MPCVVQWNQIGLGQWEALLVSCGVKDAASRLSIAQIVQWHDRLQEAKLSRFQIAFFDLAF